MERNIKVWKKIMRVIQLKFLFLIFFFLKTSVLLHRIILKGTNVASVSQAFVLLLLWHDLSFVQSVDVLSSITIVSRANSWRQIKSPGFALCGLTCHCFDLKSKRISVWPWRLWQQWPLICLCSFGLLSRGRIASTCAAIIVRDCM